VGRMPFRRGYQPPLANQSRELPKTGHHFHRLAGFHHRLRLCVLPSDLTVPASRHHLCHFDVTNGFEPLLWLKASNLRCGSRLDSTSARIL